MKKATEVSCITEHEAIKIVITAGWSVYEIVISMKKASLN